MYDAAISLNSSNAVYYVAKGIQLYVLIGNSLYSQGKYQEAIFV